MDMQLNEARIEFAWKHFLESLDMIQEGELGSFGGPEEIFQLIRQITNTIVTGSEGHRFYGSAGRLLGLFRNKKLTQEEFEERVIESFEKFTGKPRDELIKMFSQVARHTAKENNNTETTDQAKEEKQSILKKIADIAYKIYSKLVQTVKDHKLFGFVAFIAVGIAIAGVVYILKKRREQEPNAGVKESFEAIFTEDLLLESYILEATLSPKSILSKLYEAYKWVESIAKKTGDEITRTIAKVFASLILIALAMALFGLFVGPLAKLFIAIDARLTKQKPEQLKDMILDPKYNCQVGKLFKVWIVSGNVVWNILKIGESLNPGKEKYTFCDFVREKLK